MITTLREQLDLAGLDWDSAMILVQEVKEDNEYQASPGWASEDELRPGKLCSSADSILDKEFYNGFGSPECPRFIAQDAKFYYFPWQYDGATGVDKIARDFRYYQDHPIPYPGS